MDTLLPLSERQEFIAGSFPENGMFAGKDWRLSPEPFPLDKKLVKKLNFLGPALVSFYRSANKLYYRSLAGDEHPWVAEYLNYGKPQALLEAAQSKRFDKLIPKVIRPDVLILEDGIAISELDSVPGGIGLTALKNQIYSRMGFDVVGGETGMIEAFQAAIGPQCDVLISQECADYRPESEWLCQQIGQGYQILEAETYQPKSGTSVYRFFELFDLPNIPSAERILDAVVSGEIEVSPPLKPWLEEKLLLALIWVEPLADFWIKNLSRKTFEFLRTVIPYSWIVHDQPLPPLAAIPELNVNSWDAVANFSQKQRELVLKISGFNETAWGARGVTIGHDVSSKDWQAAIEHAIESFTQSPYILQKYAKAKRVEHPYFDEQGEVKTMDGRVRLCPYYLVQSGEPVLSGVLSTIVPANKKKIHGMSDAIMVPSAPC